MHGYLSAGIICSDKPTVFRGRSFELRGVDNVQGQICVHMFVPNEGYCVSYPPNIFRNTPRGFQVREYHSDIS